MYNTMLKRERVALTDTKAVNIKIASGLLLSLMRKEAETSGSRNRKIKPPQKKKQGA